MRLINDAGNGWLGPLVGVPVGSGGSILSNSYCSVNTATVTATFAGTDMTINTFVTFSSSFTGPMGTFLQEADTNGQWTGMTQFGNWDATAISSPKPGPYIRSFNTSYYSEIPTDVDLITGHTSGVGSIGNVNILLSGQIVGGTNRCHIVYISGSHQFVLVNDAGTGTIPLPGQNSKCRVGGSSSNPLKATQINSAELSLHIPVQWLVTPVERINMWANTFDSSGNLTTHWIAPPGGLMAAGGGQTQISTVGRTDVYYDQATNKVYQISSGTLDYNTEYWYSLHISAVLGKNGFTVAPVAADSNGTSYASAYSETQGETGAVFTASADYYLKAQYQTYETVPGCGSCSDWYDPFNYSFVSQRGEVINSGITFSVWVWASPAIVVTRTVTDLIQLGSSGGRVTMPGPKNVFDLTVRAFIPAKFVWGPDMCFQSTATGLNFKSTLYAGDNRDYTPFTGLDYRAMSSIMLSSAGYILPGTTFKNTGISKRYAADALQADGKTLKEDTVRHDCY